MFKELFSNMFSYLSLLFFIRPFIGVELEFSVLYGINYTKYKIIQIKYYFTRKRVSMLMPSLDFSKATKHWQFN